MWTAWGSLFEAAQLKPNSAVLVHGGTSSVGLWAILLAKDHGCTVLATTRKQDKVEKLKQAGADHVLLESELDSGVNHLCPNGVDCILELVGPDKLTTFTLANLARHGSAVVTGVLSRTWSMRNFSPADIPSTRKLTFYGMSEEEQEGLEKVPRVMEEVVRKVESGKWRKEVFVSRVFGLEEIGEAHEFMEENRAVGKAVVVVP